MVGKAFAKEHFEKNRDQILKDYFTLVGLPTIGAEARRLGDCARAAAWLRNFLRPLGFTVELLLPKSGLPVPLLLAERKAGGMDVLFYGHYDVQPPDPMELWKTPPFEPRLVDGRVFARGAQDDKGQFFSFLCGMKALIEAGEKLPTIRILLEGEEENGSYGISSLLPELAPRIPAHVLLVADTSESPDGRPAIIAGMRGVQHFQIALTGARQDLHSGVHGGLAPNPAQGMAQLLASLHHSDGSIAVDGFRDDVAQPTAEELAFAHESGESAEQYERETGVAWAGGAKGVDPVVRGCFEPTIEINGVSSGYSGPGSKTIIPSRAIAKLSLRLVPDQSPARVFKAMEMHLKEHCPRGMKLELSEVFKGLPGFRLPTDSPAFQLAASVLKEIDPRGAAFRWEGASIPIVSQIRQLTGAAPILVGFGRETDNIHAPNESYGLDQFQRCMTWAAMILSELAAQ